MFRASEICRWHIPIRTGKCVSGKDGHIFPALITTVCTFRNKKIPTYIYLIKSTC